MDLSIRAEAPDRETRGFGPAKGEIREGTEGVLGVNGYASMYSIPYSVRDSLGEYTETIEPGAFKRSVEQRDDVRLLLNHDGIPLARTKSGTLRLDPHDPVGLGVDADLESRMGLANDVRLAMERGDLDLMSFAFKATRQDWNKDYTQRSIREVKLFDVSVVTFPASAATSVKLRSDCPACEARAQAEVDERAAMDAFSAANHTTDAYLRRLATVERNARVRGLSA